MTIASLPLPRRAVLAAGVGLAGTAAVSTGGMAAPQVSGLGRSGDDGWAESGHVDRAGGRIHWGAIGAGPVLVVMPKLGGWMADWLPVARLLAPRYRVVAIDPPGHGGSTMAGPPPYIQTLPESAALVRATLEALGITHYALAGNSLGGCIAAIMAALFPADVVRLALVSVALADRMSASDLAAYDARTGEYDARGMPLPRAAETMARRFGTTSAINAQMNASRAAAGLWIRPSERGVFTCGITDYLPRIAARTLLVYGKGNEGTYQVFRDRALRLIPQATSLDVEGAGAFLHQQKPEATAALLDRFLSGAQA
ncbi:alpha/beta fold hydrolase [Novosphingobium soli]|uniref:Alpha/beta fold hydrolase n=1 Tax=Novosphingobium soli TaxID=574956 RepID=A0ABV6CVZ2_9SPHN